MLYGQIQQGYDLTFERVSNAQLPLKEKSFAFPVVRIITHLQCNIISKY